MTNQAKMIEEEPMPKVRESDGSDTRSHKKPTGLPDREEVEKARLEPHNPKPRRPTVAELKEKLRHAH